MFLVLNGFLSRLVNLQSIKKLNFGLTETNPAVGREENLTSTAPEPLDHTCLHMHNSQV